MFTKKALAIGTAVLAIVVAISYAGLSAEAANTNSALESTAARKPLSPLGFAKQAVFMVLPFTLNHERSGGTGFLIETTDYGKVIVTNRHVCETRDGGTLFYLQQGNKEWVARLITRSNINDLCIIKPPREVLAHSVGYTLSPDNARPGERVYVYGHPLLRPLTLVQGHYLSTAREPINIKANYAFDPDFVMVIGHVDFTIQPGNSGSPVLNMQNQVVGVIFATEGDEQNGLVVPVSELHRFLETAD